MNPQILKVIQEVAHCSAHARTRVLRAQYSTYEDLRSEAYVQCLTAAPKYDPEQGPAVHFFRRIAARAVAPRLANMQNVELTEADILLMSVWLNSDDGCRPSSWFGRVKAALYDCLGSDFERMFVELHYGLNGNTPMTPKQLAVEFGVSPSKLHAKAGALKKRWRNRQDLKDLLNEAKEYPNVHEDHAE